jgi:hypothetical protein
MMNFFQSMTGNTKVDVQLKNHVFYPGNIIEGVVKVENGANIDFSAVRLKVCAKEKVHLVEEIREVVGHGENQRTETRKVHHQNTNVVYKQLLTLAGNMKSQGSSQKYHMPGGTFYYPFSWQLPDNLPPSFSKKFTDNYAEIVYYVKAYVDIHTGREAKDKEIFTVLSPMPISQWGHRAPADVSRNHEVTCCCCCDKGNVQARIFMDRTLISIDRDHLQIFADMDNTGGKEPVEGIEFSLNCSITYKAGGHIERQAFKVGHQLMTKQIEPGTKGLVNGVIALRRDLIPSITTPNIEVKYTVTIEINIPYASDPCETFSVLLAQSVDETNYVPPMDFNKCAWQMMAAHSECPEYYYQPPPQPVYQPQMIPMMAPPPNAPMYQAQFTPAPLGLPSANWQQQVTPMYQGQPVPPHQNQMQWSGGYQQPQVANYQMGAPPPPLGHGSNAGSPTMPHQQPHQQQQQQYSPHQPHQQQQQQYPTQQPHQQQQQQYPPQQPHQQQQQQYPPQQPHQQQQQKYQPQQQHQYHPNAPQHQGYSPH